MHPQPSGIPSCPAKKTVPRGLNSSGARPIQDRCPANDEDIAFATGNSALALDPGNASSRSERLTQIYPDAPGEVQSQAALRHHAHARAGAQTSEAGRSGNRCRQISRAVTRHSRGEPKTFCDTQDIPTTYGAEPFAIACPTKDAVVVQRLNDAGAVLVAKLSLGALALNDIWFGGQTMNPWLLEEGSSGSSAGPGAATAAGLVGFAIGSETGGSIVSPSMRCGVTGLRPTFGRVARTGAMTLCWSLDKLGPMARSVEDTMLVLNTITGPDRRRVTACPASLTSTQMRACRACASATFRSG